MKRLAVNSENSCKNCGGTVPADAINGSCPRCLMGLGMEIAVGLAGGKSGTMADAASVASSNGSTYPSHDGRVVRADQLLGKLPNLEVIHLIGHGGMGTVFQARQTNLDRVVALKVLSPQLGADPSFAERFTREARTLAKLSQHRNIVTVFDFGITENFHYLVMELVDGVNLREAIQSQDFTPKQVLKVIPEICDALQYAHDKGVIHRDIKPENILLDKTGNVKIADFGLAKLLQPSEEDFTLTATRQVLGTYNYMAPEQIERPESVDHRADLYSLGVVLYELLTGELPIGRFALPSEKAAVDDDLDQVVLKTLEKEPSRRYQQASQFRTAVESVKPQEFKNDGANPFQENRAGGAIESSRTKDRQFQSSASILPFTATTLFQEATNAGGVMRIIGETLHFNFEDSFGIFKTSEPKNASVRLCDIVSIRNKAGIFGNKIEILANSLEAVEGCPGASQGQITVNTKKRDTPLTKRFMAEIENVAPQIEFYRQDEGHEVSAVSNWETTLEERYTTFERLKFLRVGVHVAAFSYLIAAVVWSAIFIPFFVHNAVYSGDGFFGQFNSPFAFYDTYGGWGIGLVMLLGIVSALCFCCNHSLNRYRSYHFALFSCLFAILIFPINIVALPFLLWTLVVLCLKSTRRVFRHNTMLVAAGDTSLLGEFEKNNRGLPSGLSTENSMTASHEVSPAEQVLYEDRARIPKIGLGILSGLYFIGLVVWLLITFLQQPGPYTSLALIAVGTFGTLAVVLSTASVSYLLHTKSNYHFALAVAIFGAICLPWNLVSLPLLIWSIVVLSMPSTKKIFSAAAIERQLESDYRKKMSEEDAVSLRQARTYKILLGAIALVAAVGVANLLADSFFSTPPNPSNVKNYWDAPKSELNQQAGDAAEIGNRVGKIPVGDTRSNAVNSHVDGKTFKPDEN